MRCKGMTLGKMPVLAWLAVVVAFMMLIALPPLSAAQAMLLLDRYLGAHFFDTQAGGSAILWQHFFWIFGHPEVYILVIPAFAFASEIIPVFSRKVIFGYQVMVAASCAIAFISMGVWAHHMFSVGMTPAGNAFFATSTMLVGPFRPGSRFSTGWGRYGAARCASGCRCCSAWPSSSNS